MAGKLRSALTVLAGISVPGVSHNYDVDSTPERLDRASLPCLIVYPFIDDAFFKKFDEFELATPSGSSAFVSYHVTHLLLYSAFGAGKRSLSAYPGLIDIIDAYATVIRANPLLTSTLFSPLTYAVKVGRLEWGGIEYFGAHFWLDLKVST